MDLTTVIGSVATFCLLAYSLYAGSNGDIMGAFFDMASVVMVVGGGAFVTIMSCRADCLKSFAKLVRAFYFRKKQDPVALITQIVKLADVARREGILSLQNSISEISNPFLQNGIQMVVDGTDAETVSAVLEAEIDAISQRHAEAKSVPDMLAKYAPAFGMIGTLVGLVVMLKNMSDPSAIGPGMAIALLTTLYGAMIANIIGLPLVDKMATNHDEEMFFLSIAKMGVLCLQAGDNPRMLEMKLAVMLPPRKRAELAANKAT